MKAFRLFLFLFLTGISVSSFAQRGFYQSGVTINGNYHDCTLNTPAFDFQHSSFGRFTSAQTLNMTLVEMFTWKNPSGANTCQPILRYRIYRTSDTPGSFQSITLNFVAQYPSIGNNNGDQQWQNTSTLNLLNGLTLSGTYIFEIYFDIPGTTANTFDCNQNIEDNNFGNNYRAYFEFENSDSFTDGDFTSPSWSSDNISSFSIIDNSSVAGLNGTEPTRTKTVRHSSSYAGGGLDTNYISTQIANWDASQEWRFWIGRNDGAATTQSQSLVWLYANSSNLKSPTISGYRIRLGDNSGVDEIMFQKVSNGVVTTLASSVAGVTNGLTDYGISFFVTRSTGGVWNIWSTPLPGVASTSANALGSAEAALTEHLLTDITDPSSPITPSANGYFGFMATTTNASNSRLSAEFDNFIFKALPPDTSFEFATASSTSLENDSNTAIQINILNPNASPASVDVVLVSGSAGRLGGDEGPGTYPPPYTTITLNWSGGDSNPKTIYLDPDNNDLCDDNTTIVLGLSNPSGGSNAFVGVNSSYALTIIDDEMGYDDLAQENFEVSLPATWISTPADRWLRTNLDAVGSTGYSLGHTNVGSSGSSSIALSLDTMPLTGVNTVWRFQVRYQQDGNAQSHWQTFLSANSTDLNNLGAVSGYAIGFNQSVTGGSADPLCLFKVTNGVSTVLINTGLDWVDNVGANDAVGIEVTLDENGEWSVLVDLDGGFDDLTPYGAPASDIAFPMLNVFGSRVSFTNLSSEKFRIDDISITQKGCYKIWYSQSTGASNGSIWWSQPTGGNTTASGGRFDRFQIQNGHNVTAAGDWITADLSINPGATLTGSNSNVIMFGDWFNEGTFVRGTSNITFRGREDQNIFSPSVTSFHNLTIDNDGGTVTVIDSVNVRNVAYVNEGVFNVNGKFGLHSNSTASSSLGEIKAGGSVVGHLTLQRYIPSITYQYGNWINLGCPITGRTLADWNTTLVTTGFPGSDFPAPYPFINIRHYNENEPGGANMGYENASNITNPLMTDRGYFIWLDGNAHNVRVKGPIQQGSFNHPLSYSVTGSLVNDGWNLMTNPYPSEVDWNRVSANLSGPRAFYVFDYQINSYRTYLATGAETGTGNGSRYLPHSQSFMVKVNTTGQSLTYQESYKTNNGVAFERSMGEEESSSLAIQLERNGMRDESLLFFADDSHENYDAFDALHLASPNENAIQMALISSDNQPLIIDSRPFTSDINIPVTVKMPEAGTYNLIVAEVNNLPLGACLVIEDVVTGQSRSLVSGTEMQVTINAPFEGIRFRIHGFAPAQVLITDATCFGVADGSLDITVPSSDWSVKLSDEANDLEYLSNGSVTMDGLSAGSYQLEVINPAEGCGSDNRVFVIEEPAAITAEILSAENVPCNTGETGSVAWKVNNTDWFSYEVRNHQDKLIRTAEVEGNSVMVESLPTGIYSIKVHTVCGSQTLEVDLRDNLAPTIVVDAPQNVVLDSEHSSFWLNAMTTNTSSVIWSISNGLNGEGEMFEVSIEEEGVYSYTATAKGNYCETIASGTFEIKRLLSNDNHTAISTLQQPNQITLTFGSDFDKMATVRLLDATGRIVINKAVVSTNGQTLVMNTASLSTGVYTLQVLSDKDILFTEKIFRK